MILFFPAITRRALNIVRHKTRFDWYHLKDFDGMNIFYDDRQVAQQAALALRKKPYNFGGKKLDISRKEMCLVVIDVPSPDDQALKRYMKNGEVHFDADDFYELFKKSHFSLEVVPGTENTLAYYEGRVPECGMGYGPVPDPDDI